MLESLIYGVIFFVIPAIVLGVFAITLYRYLSARKKNEASPGSFSDYEIRKRKIIMIVASVITGVFAVMAIGLCALMYVAVAYM